MEIVLKRTSNKSMAAAGKVSGLVIQALLYLGKEHLDKDGTSLSKVFKVIERFSEGVEEVLRIIVACWSVIVFGFGY